QQRVRHHVHHDDDEGDLAQGATLIGREALLEVAQLVALLFDGVAVMAKQAALSTQEQYGGGLRRFGGWHFENLVTPTDLRKGAAPDFSPPCQARSSTVWRTASERTNVRRRFETRRSLRREISSKRAEQAPALRQQERANVRRVAQLRQDPIEVRQGEPAHHDVLGGIEGLLGALMGPPRHVEVSPVIVASGLRAHRQQGLPVVR